MFVCRAASETSIRTAIVELIVIGKVFGVVKLQYAACGRNKTVARIPRRCEETYII